MLSACWVLIRWTGKRSSYNWNCHISPTDGSLRWPLLRPATAGSLSADPSSLPVFSSRHGSLGPGHGRQSGLEAAWPGADAASSQVRFVEVVWGSVLDLCFFSRNWNMLLTIKHSHRDANILGFYRESPSVKIPEKYNAAYRLPAKVPCH